MKQLSDKELARLELLSTQTLLESARHELAQKDLKIAQQKAKLTQINVIESERVVRERASRLQLSKEAAASFIATLGKKHSLKDGWGYCPDSGEIKED